MGLSFRTPVKKQKNMKLYCKNDVPAEGTCMNQFNSILFHISLKTHQKIY